MADPEKKKRCLYDVLGLNPICTADEIRSAYKRLALQLHPDKLIQSGAATPESATAAFQELVNAYEVLSDPRERVWYDSHRSQILFADVSSNGKGSSRSHDFDLFSYFSNSVYSGFSDRGKGFYKVYGDVFGKIYAREVDFAAKLGLGQDSVRPAPLMGNLECPYEQVTAFYGYWLGFCTVMDFSWVDEWDSAAGMNRRARRLMEDENAKVRKKARREYNEMVRDLAKFVKKRDKRVIEMLRRRKEEEEKRKAEEEKKKKEKEREKAERARLYEEPEWAKVDEDDGLEEEERKDEEEFYCVVCGKKFKSDKQWRNHEQSKKHKERVEEFRRSAKAEDLEFGVEEEEVEALGDEVEKEEEEKVGVDELCEEFENGVEILKEVDEAALDGDNEEKMSADEERSVLEAMLSGRRNRKKEASSQPSTSAPGKDDEMEYNKTNPRKKGRRRKGGVQKMRR
ncbi:Chaperone protein dnaJ 39 [Acorus calamus]|uniref:Chaperone protein dnaJ 39 n=1 Tax=Acorus calamus TaxID=4465 RepID=A0AAV9D834_ACOCL|nr:Chaperone protein dnaJ 39 [Acorus calamus]